MKLAYLKTYKLEFCLILILIILSFLTLTGNGSTGNSYASSGGTFWLPSAVMQSIAALYGVFIAIFILSLQSNKESLHSLANRIKPPLKIVSYIAAGTIYLNGLIIIVLSLDTLSESKMKFLLIASLISMILSLIAIVYSSLNLLSDVSGLKTSSEKFTHISNLLQLQHENSGQFLQNGKDMNFCIRALEDENPEVRKIAAKALGQMQSPGTEKALIKLLEDPNLKVRTSAIEALASAGNENSIEPLIKQLELSTETDKNTAYRTSIIETLGKLQDKRAIPPLIKILEDKNLEIKIAALYSLGILGGDKVEDALILKLNEISTLNPLNRADLEFEKQIIILLGNLESKKAIQILIRKLEDKNPKIRKFAVESLGKVKDPKAIDPLLEHLNDKNPEIRNATAYSLGTLKAEKAIPLLLEMLFEEDPELRITAAYALGNISNPKAVDSLLKTLNDNNPWVRKYAVEALGKIGDLNAIDSLVKNLNDPDSEVRWASAEALRILSQQSPKTSSNSP
jgi:HEAT repeat protein